MFGFWFDIKITDVVISICTVALVFIGFRQWKVYDRQAGIMGLMQQTADRQLALIGLQTDILEKQKEIARQGHITTHRPKLRIRNVRLGKMHAALNLIFAGEVIEGQLYVANVGNSDAIIIEFHVEVFCSQDGLPMIRPYEGVEPNNPINGAICQDNPYLSSLASSHPSLTASRYSPCKEGSPHTCLDMSIIEII